MRRVNESGSAMVELGRLNRLRLRKSLAHVAECVVRLMGTLSVVRMLALEVRLVEIVRLVCLVRLRLGLRLVLPMKVGRVWDHTNGQAVVCLFNSIDFLDEEADRLALVGMALGLDHVGADRMAVRAKDLGLHLDAEEARGELDLLAQKNLLLLEIALGDGKGSLEARVEDELPHCLVDGMLGVNHRLLHLEVDPVAGRWNRHFASSSSGRNLDDDAV